MVKVKLKMPSLLCGFALWAPALGTSKFVTKSLNRTGVSCSVCMEGAWYGWAGSKWTDHVNCVQIMHRYTWITFATFWSHTYILSHLNINRFTCGLEEQMSSHLYHMFFPWSCYGLDRKRLFFSYVCSKLTLNIDLLWKACFFFFFEYIFLMRRGCEWQIKAVFWRRSESIHIILSLIAPDIKRYFILDHYCLRLSNAQHSHNYKVVIFSWSQHA